MSRSESALAINCAGEALVGVLTLPAQAPQAAVVVVVGGPQYRAGSHRQFVQLARALADGGVAVLRFDVRGMGDSSGRPRAFDTLDDDIHAAVSALRTRLPGVQRVALWGLCDGAAAALLYLHGRPQADVQAVCLVNPWVRSELSHARTQIKHYYLQRLVTPAFWGKLLRGGVGWSALAGLVGGLRRAAGLAAGSAVGSTVGSAVGSAPAGALAAGRQASFQDRMADGLARFQGDVLLILSGNDFTAQEFTEFCGGHSLWQKALRQARLTRHEVAGADHTFSLAQHRRVAESLTLGWLQAGAGTSHRAAAPPQPG